MRAGSAHVLLALLVLLCLLPGTVQAAAPSPTYTARAEQLVRILAKDGGEQQFFSRVFLDAVPLAQWRALAADLRRQYGVPTLLGSVRADGPTARQVEVRYPRATVGFTLVVAPAPPGRVVGLRIVGASIANDSFESVLRDIAALPGQSAFAVARLGEGSPQWLHGHRPEARMATASTFKLYLLAELARAVGAGERHWADVTPLARKSFSGRLAGWPDGAPMTLHSLATAMIAESDNSAADTLLETLGRTRVDAMLARTGHAAPDAALPLLSTSEAFALKMPANADLRRRYLAADLAGRRALLMSEAARLSLSAIDVGSVAETPTEIETIEWFASPRDSVALLDWLRRTSGEALPIMAVNPGIAPADAKRWRTLGYKGGSEPGVIAMNFLGQAKDGTWYAVSGAWNNPAARVDEARFVALMTRALNLLARETP